MCMSVIWMSVWLCSPPGFMVRQSFPTSLTLSMALWQLQPMYPEWTWGTSEWKQLIVCVPHYPFCLSVPSAVEGHMDRQLSWQWHSSNTCLPHRGQLPDSASTAWSWVFLSKNKPSFLAMWIGSWLLPQRVGTPHLNGFIGNSCW